MSGPSDTSPSAAAARLRILKALPASRRFLLAFDMSLAARALLEARLRTEHPQWSEGQVRRERLRLALLGTPLPSPCE